MRNFCEVFILLSILYTKNSYCNIISSNTDLGKLCEDGLPLLTSNDKPVQCNEMSQCPLGFWCHNGGIYPSLYYCCPKNKEINNICFLSKAIGHGFEVSLRYVFNIHTRECESFMYYGIGGNENNFPSLEQCQLMCGMFSKKLQKTFSNENNNFINKITDNIFRISNDAPVTSNFDPCTQTPDIGISLNEYVNIEKRYYFDRVLSRCIKFSYKGFGGNFNNFKTVQDCEETCGSGKLQVSSCFEKYTNGTGNMKILRYYYDYKHRVCKNFFYKGHNGNNNRFVSRKQCTQLCIVSLQPDKVLEAMTTIPIISTTITTPTTLQTTTTTPTPTTINTLSTTNTTIESKISSRFSFNSFKNNNNTKSIDNNINEETYAIPKIIKIVTPINQESQQFYNNQQSNYLNSNNNQLYINGYNNNYENEYANKYINEEIFPNTNNQEQWDFKNYYQPLPRDGQISITNLTNKSTKRRRPVQEISSSAYKEFIQNLTDNKPINDDICKLPLQPGTGNLFIQRWYYDSTFHNCIPFFFKGQYPNGNNFYTKSECIKRCIHSNKITKYRNKEQYSNICSHGMPSLDLYHKLIICNSHENCLTKTHYCSFDISNSQGFCCPKSPIPPCEQELITGNQHNTKNMEKDTTIRYYFNKDTYSCTSFKYTGIGGNENNFLTIGECRRQCPEYINPCPVGIPYISKVNENVAFCSHINQECPPNYWCHIGGSKRTSTCCPMGNENALNEDSCSMNLIIGEGDERLSRYFYNKRTKQCESFIYLGKRGNSNNFYTKTDCEAICPVFENPCGFGSPFFNTIISNSDQNDLEEESQPMFCSTTEDEDESNCPEGYYCHIGATSHSTVCCPATGDPCDMPLGKGNGTAVLNRWYFNSKTKVCSSFVYSGIGGNVNNFLSKEDCSQTCDVMLNPCPTGHPHITVTGDVTQCGDSSMTGGDENGNCPPTYWCHYGSSYESSTCCPNAGNPCILEMDEGEGNLNVTRYYYDYKSRKCKKMTYKGMKGNQNSFLTLAACEARCPVFKNPCLNGEPEKLENGEDIKFCSMSNPKKICGQGYYCHIGYSEESTVCCLKVNDNPCSQPIIRGGGPSSLSRFYFDSATRTCLPFIYSGANGNMNNFISKDECESSCPVLRNPCSDDEGPPATDDNGQYIFCASRADNTCPSGYFCHYGEFLSESICCPDGDEDSCNKPLQIGIGDKELIRWYFDNNLRRCSKFKYKGKSGNSNNFITLQECQMTCKEYQNPCSDGDPALNFKGEIIFCSTTNNTCPNNYFCHYGAIESTTVCCPLQQQSDPCYAPLSIGNGLLKLSRWYFNHHTRQCLQFTYTGINGNANNYLTEEDCSNSCPVVVNPCPGIDRIYPKAFADSLKCSSDSVFLCPIGYWCHLGSTPDTTLCCPNAQDPCKQELEIGIKFKTDSVKRWYYDSNTKECKNFVFKGLKGNQNNFLTKDDCIKTCPSFTNVCQIDEPYRDKIYKKMVNCDNNKDCPSGYFCHRGSSSTFIRDKNINNVCCRSLKHPCEDEVIIGNGKHSLPRWYFNSQKKQCMEFTYSGSGGSSNNFITRDECTETCLYDNTNPCRNGEPYKNVYGEIKYCSPQSSIHQCPPKYFCHIGDNKKSTVCCPSTISLPCQKNMEIGYGDKQLSRYYYNYHLKQCLPFIYTGMGGNSNNFLTKEDCVTSCYLHPSSTPILFSTAEWPWYSSKEIKKRSISLKCGMPQAKSCKGSPIGYFYEGMSGECAPIRPCPDEPLDNIFWNLNECTNICTDISNKRTATDKEEDYLLIRSLGFLSHLLSNSKDRGNLR